MYFIEDVIKYSYVDELKYMINHYNMVKGKYPYLECLWKNQMNECCRLLNIIQTCSFSQSDMEDIKKYSTIARELRLGEMNKSLLLRIV